MKHLIYVIILLNILGSPSYSQELKSYFNRKNDFTISYPKTWKIHIQPNKSNTKFYAALHVNNFILHEFVSVQFVENIDSSLDSAFYNRVKHLREFHCEDIIDGGESIINERKYYWFKSEIKSELVEIKKIEYITIDKNRLIIFTLKQGKPDNFNQRQGLLRKMIYTFHFGKNNS